MRACLARIFSLPLVQLSVRLLLIGLGFAVARYAFGDVIALLFVAVAALVYASMLFYQTAQLRNWLRSQDLQRVPDGRGAWAEIYSVLYRTLRSSKHSSASAAQALERFQRAGAALPDGIAILDPSGAIEWCNPAAEAHFSLVLERDRGKPIGYLVRQPEFVDHLNSERAEPLILRGWRGSNLTIAVQIVPYGDAQKLIISRDITQIDRAETVRRDFVANVSHELRTPLTVVSGFLETLQDMQHVDAKMLDRSMSLMRDQTLRMQRLVEDLLTLSHLESGEPPLDELIDAPRLVRSLLGEAQHLSRQQHRVSIRVDSALWLRGADAELHSAFTNLVANAVRYTPTDGEVRIAWERIGDEGVFSVEDSGVGIEPEHLPRLTERFYRVDKSRSREGGGTGLGLAIVKHALQRHQARLEIRSEPRKGSRFAAHFPSQRLVAPPSEEDQSTAPAVVEQSKAAVGL